MKPLKSLNRFKKNQFLHLIFILLFCFQNLYGTNTAFTNKSRFVFYYRASEVVEITGNEDTFVAYFNLNLNYKKKLSLFETLFKIDADFIEELNFKARLFNETNPPSFLLNELSLNLGFKQNHNITIGAFKPLIKQLKIDSLFRPLLFRVGRHPNGKWIPHGYVLGNRDVPLMDSALTDRYDTGIVYAYEGPVLKLALGLVNGEEGLDSNSAKTISFLMGLKNKSINSGLSGQLGNIGSVPIKEYRHQYKLYYHQNYQKITYGFEALAIIHGVRDKDALEKTYPNNNTNLVTQFGYKEGFFTPFSLINDSSYKHPSWLWENAILGFSSSFYLKIKDIFLTNLHTTFHLSQYDPNIFSENKNIYAQKYRAFLRFEYKISNNLDFIISDTYTYDPVFLYEGQFYDREERGNHPILDNDLFAGLAFYL